MKTLCINLDERVDRWTEVSAEFTRIGIEPVRVSAVSGDNRPLAFNQSVYKSMLLAIGNDLLLFEDDVAFDVARLPDIDVPDNYMTVHLGCNIIGVDTTDWQMPTAYSPTLARLHNCWQSHATLYSKECVAYILRHLNHDVLDADNNIFDDWLRRKVLSQGRSYVLRPMIAYQRPSFSNIWDNYADYTGAHAQGNNYLMNNL